MLWNKTALTAVLLVAVVLACLPIQADDKKDEKKAAFDQKAFDEMNDKAVAYLKSKQGKDGSWSKAGSSGITGMVLIGLFDSGKVKAEDEVAANGLKFVETLIDSKEGHIAKAEGRAGFHKNYLTSVNLVALQKSGQDKYKATIAAASKYLKSLQLDESQDKTKKDVEYGGVGYGPKTRPDMSNTHFFIDAMKASGVPTKDEVYSKALVFVSRCQNLKSEHNTQSWAEKINDGSFIYVLSTGKGPKDKDKDKKDEKRPGYGSMTYVGLKALFDCGCPKDDDRYKKALEWVSKNYSVTENAGRSQGDQGYYYYLCMMAGCLDALGIDQLEDAKGKKHDWRAEILAALAKKQRKDGSWANETGTWMESNADLCTAYALVALKHCKPKSK